VVKVELYTRSWCGYCYRAKAMLESRGVAYEEYDIGADPASATEMVERASGRRRVPQIFVDGVHVGGSDDLQAAMATGEFDRLLAG
jgi:glutaredoxin 3